MPYSIRKAKCKQTDGDRGRYVLSYTDNKGKRHRNCHTSRKKARAQISAIEMPEGVEDLEESWVPLAARITVLLEEELANLAGSFILSESVAEDKGPTFDIGERVKPAKVPKEMLIHFKGKVPYGEVVGRNLEKNTYDVKWDPPERPERKSSDDDDDDWELENQIDAGVKAVNLVSADKKKKAKKS